MFGINQHIRITICKDAEDAVLQGFDYSQTNMRPVEIKQVVVVKKGTQGGNSTVDLILRDDDGNEYVTVLTGALLRMIPV